MKIATQPIVMGLGAATICTLSITSPLVSWNHEAVYHVSESATPLFLAVLVEFCLVWGVFATILYGAERVPALKNGLWLCVGVMLSLLSFKAHASLHGLPLTRRAAVLSVGVPLVCAAVMALPAFRSWRAAERYQSFLAIALGFTSFVGVMVLTELLCFGWAVRHLNEAQKTRPENLARIARPSHGRVIWIVFDELSFEQVYARRYPGLQLPAFDALASQAVVMTQVKPAGMYTEMVLPSLIAGSRFDGLDVGANGNLKRVHDERSDAWEPFDARNTVFADAVDRGERTGLVGWFNPYCRLLPGLLDRCMWVWHEAHPGHMYADQTLGENLLGPVSSMAALLPGRGIQAMARSLDRPTDAAAAHLAEYREIEVGVDETLGDGSLGFVMLHLPTPHPPGIYDRRRRVFTTTGSSYIDNLALADLSMAHIREVLEQRGEWNEATVVVMGDHSWRTKQLWRGDSDWTAEDEAASHGGNFDPRPVYVVKLPQETVGARIDAPFAAERTRALLDAAMDGKLTKVEGLREFVAGGR